MKKKILYIIPRFTAGGAEQLVFQYARFFLSQGYEVAVASVVGGGEWVEKFKGLDVKIYVSSGKKIAGWQGLKKFTYEFQPDIIHSHVFSGDLAGYLLKRKNKKIKWISTQHNVEFGNLWIKRFIWGLILKHADNVIAVSKNVADYSKNAFRVPEDRISVVLNGIELETWLQAPKANYNGKSDLQIATIGRLEKQKGHIYLIRALAQLKAENWHWHVYGEGSLGLSLKKEVKKLGLDSKVTWHGVSNNLISEYKNIDVVAQPSLWEGLSLVVMEAMTAGRVVVGTPWALENLAHNKQTGLVVKTGDVESLVEVLGFCISNPDVLEEMGDKAREVAREKFGIENNFELIKEIYQKHFKPF